MQVKILGNALFKGEYLYAGKKAEFNDRDSAFLIERGLAVGVSEAETSKDKPAEIKTAKDNSVEHSEQSAKPEEKSKNRNKKSSGSNKLKTKEEDSEDDGNVLADTKFG